ncbi:MAG: hypothetical protein KAW56_14240 [Candidatus Marinimicrobia bacterium]|nr:hypothetical protein [Candidatus Neomarinimicrobiota bacterium]
MKKNFERHFIKTLPLIRKLTRSGRNSSIVLSLLLVESYFRPSYLQFLEYISWILMLFFHRQQADNISLGFAQIKYKYWKMLNSSKSNSITDIKKMTSIYFNYDYCDIYLSYHCKNYKDLDYSSIIKLYNGNYTKYYYKLFSLSMELLKQNLKTSASFH